MPVRKYHSVDQLPPPRPRKPQDPENLRIAFQLLKLALELSRARPAPGVRKFRSLVEVDKRQREPNAG